MEPTQPTAAAWRQAAAAADQADAKPLELPSGMTILARRPPLQEWILQGRLPSAFAAIVLAQRGGEPQAPPSAEEVLAMGRFVFAMVRATVVSPRIVEAPASEAEIAYADIPAPDVDAIMAFALRSQEVAALEEFRGGRAPAAARGHRAPVWRAPKRDRGDS